MNNIRVKYTQHPQTGEIQILEEDHYYPYGLKHQGYNGGHQVIGIRQPGTDITLIDVTPDVTDTYKYKFNGMEWQDEFDVNVYDFGVRNYDPALGRWMNIDPMAEMMRRHSPYNYAFNNPVYFIDPDGMFPTDSYGMSLATGSYESYNFDGGKSGGGYNVRTFDKATGKTLDFQTVSSLDGVSYDTQSEAIIINNSAAYQSYFGNVADYAANADVSLGSGDCGDCGDNLKNMVPCVECHHTASIPQENGKGLSDLFKSRQSGYIQYGGNMRSNFIGSVVGKDGVLYGSVDGLISPSDRSSKIKLLNYIIQLKDGGEIGYNLVESILKDADVNIRTFKYPTQEMFWVKRRKGEYRHYRTKWKKGYIINNKDTIK